MAELTWVVVVKLGLGIWVMQSEAKLAQVWSIRDVGCYQRGTYDGTEMPKGRFLDVD